MALGARGWPWGQLCPPQSAPWGPPRTFRRAFVPSHLAGLCPGAAARATGTEGSQPGELRHRLRGDCDSTPIRSVFNAVFTQRGGANAKESLTELGKSRTDLFGGEKKPNPPEKGQLFSLLGARVTFALQSSRVFIVFKPRVNHPNSTNIHPSPERARQPSVVLLGSSEGGSWAGMGRGCGCLPSLSPLSLPCHVQFATKPFSVRHRVLAPRYFSVISGGVMCFTAGKVPALVVSCKSAPHGASGR